MQNTPPTPQLACAETRRLTMQPGLSIIDPAQEKYESVRVDPFGFAWIGVV
jgi:hypothetical protein